MCHYLKINLFLFFEFVCFSSAVCWLNRQTVLVRPGPNSQSQTRLQLDSDGFQSQAELSYCFLWSAGSALCVLFFCSLCFVLLWFGEAAAVIKGFTPFVVCGFWSLAELRSSALRLVRLNPQSVFFFLTFGNYSPSAHLLLSESQSASAVNSTHQLSAARVKRTPAGCSCPWCL